MTFSLVGRCADTAALGIAVSSSSPAVAARCAHVRAGVGAAGSQNVTDPRLGRRLLDLLAGGACARRAVDAVVAEAGALAAYRQLLVVDASGETAAYSGERTLGRHAQANVRDAVAAGNLLAGEEVPAAMAAEFASTVGRPLAERLLAALRAGLDAGGEAGPVRSAGLLVCDRVEWPVTDLRVDWHDDPVGELERLWAIWRPQAGDYVTRALDPASAPGYGVPGDDRP